MKRRAAIIFGVIGLLALGFAIFVIMSVRRNLAPAPDNAPVVQQGRGGVPDLREEVVLDGLTHVWDIGFLPDGTALFTERDGTISSLADGKKQRIHTLPDVYARGEGGLLGLAIDPAFAENKYIFACYATESDVRVSRWRVNGQTSGLTDKTDIVTGIPVNTSFYPGRHSGCRLRFGADNFLWVGTGDAADGTNPQDPKSLGGKVLRVDRDGKAASGNLGGDFDARIYSYGHRNIQGLAMYDKAQDGSYGFSVEHGPDKDDEINPLKAGNMGWNPVPLYNELVPMTDKEEYPSAIEPIWVSGKSTIAPSGMTFIRGGKWRGLEGRLAVAVLKNKHLRIFKLGKGNKVESEELLFTNKYGRIRSVVMGPDQAMYLTTDNGEGQDKIIKVTPR